MTSCMGAYGDITAVFMHMKPLFSLYNTVTTICEYSMRAKYVLLSKYNLLKYVVLFEPTAARINVICTCYLIRTLLEKFTLLYIFF